MVTPLTSAETCGWAKDRVTYIHRDLELAALAAHLQARRREVGLLQFHVHSISTELGIIWAEPHVVVPSSAA